MKIVDQGENWIIEEFDSYMLTDTIEIVPRLYRSKYLIVEVE